MIGRRRTREPVKTSSAPDVRGHLGREERPSAVRPERQARAADTDTVAITTVRRLSPRTRRTTPTTRAAPTAHRGGGGGAADDVADGVPEQRDGGIHHLSPGVRLRQTSARRPPQTGHRHGCTVERSRAQPEATLSASRLRRAASPREAWLFTVPSRMRELVGGLLHREAQPVAQHDGPSLHRGQPRRAASRSARSSTAGPALSARSKCSTGRLAPPPVPRSTPLVEVGVDDDPPGERLLAAGLAQAAPGEVELDQRLLQDVLGARVVAAHGVGDPPQPVLPGGDELDVAGVVVVHAPSRSVARNAAKSGCDEPSCGSTHAAPLRGSTARTNQVSPAHLHLGGRRVLALRRRRDRARGRPPGAGSARPGRPGPARWTRRLRTSPAARRTTADPALSAVASSTHSSKSSVQRPGSSIVPMPRAGAVGRDDHPDDVARHVVRRAGVLRLDGVRRGDAVLAAHVGVDDSPADRGVRRDPQPAVGGQRHRPVVAVLLGPLGDVVRGEVVDPVAARRPPRPGCWARGRRSRGRVPGRWGRTGRRGRSPWPRPAPIGAASSAARADLVEDDRAAERQHRHARPAW